MNIPILLLAIVGACVTVIAHSCAGKGTDAKLLGKIYWSVIGMIGYALLATAAITQIRFTIPILSTIFGLVTLWLIIKAIRIKKYCPGCCMVWLVNFFIVYRGLFH